MIRSILSYLRKRKAKRRREEFARKRASYRAYVEGLCASNDSSSAIRLIEVFEKVLSKRSSVLDDPEYMHLGECVSICAALGRARNLNAIPLLVRVFDTAGGPNDTQSAVRKESIDAIANIGGSEALIALVSIANKNNGWNDSLNAGVLSALRLVIARELRSFTADSLNAAKAMRITERHWTYNDEGHHTDLFPPTTVELSDIRQRINDEIARRSGHRPTAT